MAQVIQRTVEGDIFRIEPVNPYPTDHTTLNVTVTPNMVQITCEKQESPVALEIWGKEYDFKAELIVVNKEP